MSANEQSGGPDMTAAEHALRLLSGPEAGDARARESSDPGFAAEAARWRGRLASLHEETNAVAPPDAVWQRIEAAIGSSPAANDNVVALRRKLFAWRAAAAGMTALAASLALVIGLRPAPSLTPPQQQVQQRVAPLVAMIGDKGAVAVVASWDPAARQLVLAVPGTMPADARHSHELWVIPAGGKPTSLGTMPAGKRMHMRLAEAIADLLQDGATIAISVEPPGGSPTGAPTGPVVAAGALSHA